MIFACIKGLAEPSWHLTGWAVLTTGLAHGQTTWFFQIQSKICPSENFLCVCFYAKCSVVLQKRYHLKWKTETSPTYSAEYCLPFWPSFSSSKAFNFHWWQKFLSACQAQWKVLTEQLRSMRKQNQNDVPDGLWESGRPASKLQNKQKHTHTQTFTQTHVEATGDKWFLACGDPYRKLCNRPVHVREWIMQERFKERCTKPELYRGFDIKVTVTRWEYLPVMYQKHKKKPTALWRAL